MRAIAGAPRRAYIPIMSSKPAPAPPPAGTASPAPGNTIAPNATGGGQTPEVGGRQGPEPTRYGDWEKDGRCVDF